MDGKQNTGVRMNAAAAGSETRAEQRMNAAAAGSETRAEQQARAEQGERDAAGKFVEGNRGGPGNPFARQTARLRKAMMDAVSPEDIAEVIAALKEKAKTGDMAAAKLLLSYTVGKPREAVDPDTLDQHEFQTIANNHLPSAESVMGIFQGMPLDLMLPFLENLLPLLRESKWEKTKEMINTPAPEVEYEEEDELESEECSPGPVGEIPEWMRHLEEQEKEMIEKLNGKKSAGSETRAERGRGKKEAAGSETRAERVMMAEGLARIEALVRELLMARIGENARGDAERMRGVDPWGTRPSINGHAGGNGTGEKS